MPGCTARGRRQRRFERDGHTNTESGLQAGLLFFPEQSVINLSICIVNWNTREFLRQCLSSIEEFPPASKYEIIVVDNASSDSSAEMVRSDFPSVHLIQNSDNVGYAAANNQALRQSVGRWLLLLNPDIRVLATTFAGALATAAAMPKFGALGIKQIGGDGAVQRSVRSFPEPHGVFWELFGFAHFFPNSRIFGSYRMTWFDYTDTVEVDQPMATFLLTTRQVYEEVGGMDERFPIFFNDVDWCFRIKMTGRKIYYTDRSEIIHYGGAGTGQVGKSKMARESKKSFLEFYNKHYKQTLSPVVYTTIRLMVLLSMLLQRDGGR